MLYANGIYPSANKCNPLQTEFVGKFGFKLPHQWLGDIEKVKAKIKILKKDFNKNEWVNVTESYEQEFNPGVDIEYSVKCLTNVEENCMYKGIIYYKLKRVGILGKVWEVTWKTLETNPFNIYCCESQIIRRPTQWQVSYSQGSSYSPWTKIASSGYYLNELAFGDFNGDGLTDIFHPTGSKWEVSFMQTSGTVTNWETIATSAFGLNELTFGDFNGDRLTDIFHPTGSKWEVSFMQTTGLVTNWLNIGTSGYGLSELAFGDFNGDRLTDIFHPTGSKWEVSYMLSSGIVSSWTKIATSGYGLNDIAFGDYNGDGLTDVFHSTGSKWEVSHMQTSGVVSNWSTIASSTKSIKDLSIGKFRHGINPYIRIPTNNFNLFTYLDFNGDQKTDFIIAN